MAAMIQSAGGWIATGLVTFVIGEFINTTSLCVTSCAGKGNIFVIAGVLAVILGIVITVITRR